MRHASFFSGVGGLDLGFERAGIHTVSVSEIDPYANAVLAERFPDAPNLGSITEVEANDIPEADIWSGGFPCQDLSVAGKRAGFAGKRSSLAFTFLDLVERRRPRWLVLENVPGLFSSNQGRDFLRLLSEMDGLGYFVAWRTLDARYFGVAQRRRRVFIVASLESDRAEQVLFECEGGCGHLAPSKQERQGVASGAPDSTGIAGAITRRFSKGVNSTIDEPLIVSPSPDPNGVRAADGLARRLGNQHGVEGEGSTPAYQEEYADTLAARDWKRGVSNQDIGRKRWLAIVRSSQFAGYTEDNEVGGTLRAGGGDLGGGSEHLMISDPEGVGGNQLVIGSKADSNGMRTVDGLARRLDNQSVLSFPSRFGSNANVTENQAQSMTLVQAYRKSARAQTNEDSETWVKGDVANTLTSPQGGGRRDKIPLTHATVGGTQDEDDLLPVGLDSHRYRCCGNGVVASVAEWIGRRIVAVDMLK